MIVRSRAPLRLSFAGGGTDIASYSEKYGGCCLNATVGMYAYCTIEDNENGQCVEFNSVDVRDTLLPKKINDWMIKRFRRGIPCLLKVTTYSDAPVGSGLGASSSMAVAIVAAYVEFFGLPIGKYDIAKIAYQIEREDMGLAGGSQDHHAAAFGGFNFMEFVCGGKTIVGPLLVKDSVVRELECSTVLYYTGISRRSDEIIKEQEKEPNKEHLDAIRDYAYLMKDSLMKGNLPEVAGYLNKSWEEKKNLTARISNQQIEDVFSVANKNGAYAGKVCGAGGGGYIIFMTDPTNREHLMGELNKLGGCARNIEFTKEGVVSWKP